MKTKITSAALVKAGPDSGLEEGQFVVYPSTFTREPDSYGDVVKAGAFADTIAEWQESGRKMPGLYGHRMDDPDFFVATADEMGEDDHGWWVKGTFDMDSPKAERVYKLVKSGRVSQLSFAYDVLDEGSAELEDGRKANELRKLKVYEFSFVPVGANQDTSVVAVKAPGSDASLPDEVQSKISDAIAALAEVASTLQNLLPPDGAGTDDAEASGQADANGEEPPKGANPEERGITPSAKALSLQIDIAARQGQKEDSQ